MSRAFLGEIGRHRPSALVVANLLLGISLAVAAAVAALAEEQPKQNGATSHGRPAATEPPRRLIDREPFDLLTVRSGKDLRTLEVRPLVAEDGGPLNITESDRRLTVELIDHPGRQFAIAARHVARHQAFPEILLEEARRQLEQKEFDLAFGYLQRLREEYHDFPGTDQLLEDLLVQNAVERFQTGALAEALGMLEEAQRRNPQRPGLARSIQNVAQRMVQHQVDREDWPAARALVARFEQDGPAMEDLVRTWRQRFSEEAKARLKETQQLTEAGNLRDALEQARQALRIDPQSSSARQQLRSLVERYPLVRIATLAPGSAQPPHATLTWSGRRNKRLLYRDLCEIVGYGPEGGEYLSPFGTVMRQIDGMQVSVILRDRLTPATGHHLSRHLLEDASDAHPQLSPLTRLIERLSVPEVRQLDIYFRTPHVRPEALLAFVPRTTDFTAPAVPQNGPYAPLEDDAYDVFVRKDTPGITNAGPQEIRFQSFASTRDALEALRTGEVHLIDRLDPASAAALLAETPENLVVDHYPAPVLHLLVPNFDNPYLRNRDFRRGLLYGINRQEILRDRLLGGQQLDGCRLISGPIPIGVSPDDPVSYGYDLTISPRDYEPLMSVALREMAAIELSKGADGDGSSGDAPEFPPLEKLILGHPGSEVSHQACLAIVQYLRRVGLPCELKVVDPEATRAASVGVDLLYVELQVAEPLVDIPRMFDTYVPTMFQPHYFQLGIRQLRESRSWPEVRENFWSLHRLAHDDLLILPLFQLRDHFAYHRGLDGIGNQPMSLFQQVERWEIQPTLETTED